MRMLPTSLLPTALAMRLLVAVVLLFAQHGALRHAYSHFGLVPDPYYAQRDSQTPAGQGCDLGVVHAALDGDPPSAFVLLPLPSVHPVPRQPSDTAFTPRTFLSFRSRAPPDHT